VRAGFDYGRRRGVWRHTGEAFGQAEVGPGDGEPPIRLTTDLNLGIEGPRALAGRRLQAGEQVFCALSWGDGAAPETFVDAHQRLTYTGTSGTNGSAAATSPITRGARTGNGPP
jgi:alpha,alpha-trehalase